VHILRPARRSVARVYNTYITGTCAGWTRLRQAHGISRLQYARGRLNREHDTLYNICIFVLLFMTYLPIYYIILYVLARACLQLHRRMIYE